MISVINIKGDVITILLIKIKRIISDLILHEIVIHNNNNKQLFVHETCSQLHKEDNYSIKRYRLVSSFI